MHRVRVKIEGLGDPAEAVEIARMGADVIGLVFAESPRRVTAGLAREITAALPPFVATIGVFVDAGADEINSVVRESGIGYVQLHGREMPQLVGQIDAPVVKAFRVRDENWLDELTGWLEALGDSRENLAAVLLDAYHPALAGGSGRRFNWDMVATARCAGRLDGVGPIILAGGLDAECVGRAVEVVRPWAVDVASGVESSPGVKDLARVAAFIEAARRAGL